MSRQRSRVRRRIVLLSVLLALIAVAVVIVTTSSRGGRSWFSPDTLEYRYQSERLAPLADVPIYRSGYEYDQNELVKFLIRQGYWSPRSVATPRWVATNHWNMRWHDGNSDFHREFGWQSKKWIEWTQEHPALAQALWPRVLAALRAGDRADEVEVTRLMRAAEAATTVDQFNAYLDDAGKS